MEMSLKIEKGIPIQRLKKKMQPVDPELHKIAKEMEVGDSVLVESEERAKRLMRYIGKLHPHTSDENLKRGAKSRADDDGNIRVWRVNYWHEN